MGGGLGLVGVGSTGCLLTRGRRTLWGVFGLSGSGVGLGGGGMSGVLGGVVFG